MDKLVLEVINIFERDKVKLKELLKEKDHELKKIKKDLIDNENYFGIIIHDNASYIGDIKKRFIIPKKIYDLIEPSYLSDSLNGFKVYKDNTPSSIGGFSRIIYDFERGFDYFDFD